MLPEQSSQLLAALKRAAQALAPDAEPALTLERPKVAAHGDIASNLAMQLAKPIARAPRELAQLIIELVMADPQAKTLIESAEVAGPGFINFRLSQTALMAVLDQVATLGSQFGSQPTTKTKVLVEFVSANPTGPLHVGHARQAALGDALCRLFTADGYAVSREFYYNDAGNQIDNLAISVQARAKGIAPESPDYPADGYRGDYILDIARDYLAGLTVQASDGQAVTAKGDTTNLEAIRQFAVAYLRR